MASGSRPAGLVTGGAGGIGLAIVSTWAGRGVAVAAVDRDPCGESRVRALCEPAEVPFAYYVADVRDYAGAQTAVADAAARFGSLDYLVLNAGVTADRVIWKMDEQDWDEVVGVNLKGAFTFARAAAPLLRAQGTGCVVFVSSINALRGKFGQGNYAAAKAGLIGLARTLAIELGPSGVRVNVVAPGLIRTPMSAALPPEILARARAESPLGRLGEPEDVARAVDFLCRPEARHITGVVLRVDGGQALAAGCG